MKKYWIIGCLCFLWNFCCGEGVLYAQAGRITLEVKNTLLVDVFEQLQAQSGMNFIYNERIVSGVRPVSLNVRDVPVEQVLEEILKNTELRYDIHDKIIVIREKEKAEPQQTMREITGVVRDERQEVLPGVTVLLKGSAIGVATDQEGRFKMRVPEGEVTLVFSFVGMQTMEYKVLSTTPEIQVVLRLAAGELDEVVITGYAQTTKRKATGSVAVLRSDVFENRAQTNVDNLLQGQIAGVSVSATSGRPGESSRIRIRGTNTLSGDAEPLWVVDGVPLQRSVPNIKTEQIKAGDFDNIFVDGIAGINPNDIENVTILKDASATAIYGSRAAGGVIVVTTKRGVAGKMRINYSANVSVDMKPQRDANLMNSREKLDWEQELWEEFSAQQYAVGEWYPRVGIIGMLRSGRDDFAGMKAEEQEAYIRDLARNTTDWFDVLFDNSVSTNHHLSMAGGAEKVTYYVSFGYTKNNGLVKKTGYDRYNLNTNFVILPHERVNLQLGIDLVEQISRGPSLRVDPYTYAYFANPYEKPYNDDGSYRPDYTYYNLSEINDGTAVKLPANGFNILREINETSSKVDNTSAALRLNLDLKFSEKFKFSGLLSYGFVNNKTDNILGSNTYAAYADRFSFDKDKQDKLYGSITQTSANNANYNVRGQFVYSDDFWNGHSIVVLAGTELRGEKAKSIYEKRYGYDEVTGNSSMPVPSIPEHNTSIDYSVLQSYAQLMDELSGQTIEENRFASFYASLDYYLKQKYILSASFRTDGSNNFGSDEQFNPTWSVGGAWHIGEEGFMESLKPVLNRLTLRMAAGFTGNINKGYSPELIMEYSGSYRKVGSDFYRIASVLNAPNPKLRWEKTKDMKVSLDFGMFGERLTGLVEGYYRLSSDVVTSVRVLTTTGFSKQGYNTSEIRNSGIEATLNGKIIDRKDWKLNASVNVALNRNKLVKYNSPTGQIDGNTFEGYPLGAVFAGKAEGIDPETGLYKFKLRSDASVVTASDLNKPDNYRYYLGTTIAPVTGGFTVSVGYKGVKLSVGGSYSLNAKMIDKLNSPADYTDVRNPDSDIRRETIQTSRSDLYGNHLNVPRQVLSRWTPSRTTGAEWPRIIDYYGNRLGINDYSPTDVEITRGAYLENVSFLRVRNMTLSYTVPKHKIARIKLASLGFALTVNNLFTVTNYSGIDPETPGAVYPLSRSVTFGINLGF